MRNEIGEGEKDGQLRRRWADSTINRYFSFLGRVFSRAVEDGILARNPLAKFKRFKEENRPRFFTDDELRQLQGLLLAADDRRRRNGKLPYDGWALVLFAIETGLREADQFGLRWEYVDLENGILTLPMPKQGETHQVPLTETAKAVLRSLTTFTYSPFVFPALRNRPHGNQPPRQHNMQSLCPG